MEIRYTKQAAKFINSLDKTMRLRIKEGIERLTLSPPRGDIKALQGASDNLLRLRIGKYRIIYKYSKMHGMSIVTYSHRLCRA